MEYQTGYLEGGMPNCQIRGNIIQVVTNRLNTTNSITYTFNSAFTSGFLPPCNNQPGNSGPYLGYTNTYYNLDSLIFSYQSHSFGCDMNDFCYNDTVYIDSAYYNGRKINDHNEGIIACCSSDTTFVEGLGEVRGGYGREDNTAPQGGFSLIYYHKVSGEIWGTPYYFNLPNGIETLKESDLTAIINPNPVVSDFQIILSHAPLVKTIFSLYEATGKLVKNLVFTSPTTIIDRDGIADGIYFWSISENGRDIVRDKIVFK